MPRFIDAQEALYHKGIMPYAVIRAIQEAFPRDSDSIIASLRYHHIDGFWSFTRWGMFVGVEEDGFIHT